MMKLQSIIISFSLFFMWSTTAKAQSMDELLKVAIDNNLELKVLENEYLAALERAPQVSQWPDPEAGVGVFPLPVETRLGAQTFRLSASQMFPWFGTLDSKSDLELAKAKALYERIAARALNLSFEVKKAYYNLYELEQSQMIIQRNITILEALERLALTKVESGKASVADVLRVQLKIEELKQELEILETSKTNPIADINQLLNRSLETPIIATDSFSFAIIPFDKDTLAANIQANHPMLRMFELQQEVSKQAIVLNGLDGKPSIGVGLDYIFVNPRTDAEPSNNGRDILQLRALVKIPLYRKKYEAKEREENLKIAALENLKEDVLTKFTATIKIAFADYETAKLKAVLYERQIEITKAAINVLETDYSTKGNNFDELLRLEKELVDYDLKMIKAIIQSHQAKVVIEKFILND